MGEDRRAIGVFDSGIGGLTAMRELAALLPHEDIVYFGDTGRVPYGTRSRETIVKYARQDARFLCSFHLKLLLIACGTASYAALDTLKEELPIPVYGVVEGASRRAVELTRTGRVAVLATPATISGHVFGKCLKNLSPDITVMEKACPLFVPIVENGRFQPEDPIVRILTEEYLAPVREAGVDTIILGCTHYPLLLEAISRCVPGAALISSGAEAAKMVAASLRNSALAAPQTHDGTRRYFVSDSVEQFRQNAGMYLCHPLDGDVEWVDIEKYE